ncbi:MAG TPA: hypothetical protein VJC11_03525 [Patescibacteria group bacterium]|nr:hypothetical protein [Patescibacteria group bacterium]
MNSFFQKTILTFFISSFLFVGLFTLPQKVDAALPALVPKCATRTAIEVQTLGPCNVCDGLQVGVNITQLMLGLLGAAALLMFTYGGVLMILSRGYAEQSQKGKEVLYNATKGVIIVLASWVIVNYSLAAVLGLKDYSKVSLFGATDNKPWYEVACTGPTAQFPLAGSCVSSETGQNLDRGTECGAQSVCDGAGRCISECLYTYTDNSRSCQNVDSRTGGTAGCQAGICPGPANIQCCTIP